MQTLSDLVHAKQVHYFRLVDVDGDGLITASDWAEIGRNLASMRRLKLGTPAHDAVMSTMGLVWANLSPYSSYPDRSKVTEDDWLRFEIERVIYCDDDWYEVYVNTIVKNVFRLLDTENTGFIGRGEYMDLALSFWVKPQNAVIAFEKMDADGDGRIGYEEFIGRVLEYHRSEDPEAPGNWLFGPWDIWGD